MKRTEFDNLKVGDTCVVKQGYDRGKKVIVRYIECEQIVIRHIDGDKLRGPHGNTDLRITDWHQLDIATNNEES